MTRVLFLAVVVAQALDVLTWMAMPRAAEVNPLARELHSGQAWLVKSSLLLLVMAETALVRYAPAPKYPVVESANRTLVEVIAVLAIAAGCLGAGSNLAAISWANAAEAPRPALLVIPAVPKGPSPSTGVTTTTTSGTDAGRTPASRPYGAVQAPDLRGRASWYAAPGSVAAAGPELRQALGRGWRGTWIRVSAGGRAVVVRLDDWCQCYRGEARERLIDLSDDDFAVLAPLPVGVLRVRVATIVPPATDR